MAIASAFETDRTMTDTPPDDQHKVSHWDRPKPPHDWRWVVGGIGRTLITIGLLMFGFVAYQLWGTGIQTAQAQRDLSAQFDKLVTQGDSTSPTVLTSPPVTSPATSTTGPLTTDTTIPTIDSTTTTVAGLLPAQPLPDQGEAVARLEIPRMGLHRIIVEGATAGDLAKGPGHFPETPLPGQLGNAAVAGHRTTHGHPFYDIDQLQPGDEIIITTVNGRYVYQVTGTEVVSANDYEAVIPTTDPTKATLTLVSCTPRYSSTNRIVVHSELVADKSDPLTIASAAPPSGSPTLPDEGASTTAATAPPAPAVSATTAITAPGSVITTPATAATTPGVAGPRATSPDAFADGWLSDASAIPQTLLWGLLLAAIAYGALRLSRVVRRYWVGLLAAFVPFIVVLYFFYENVNRLLPPNL
ncbi:MAG: sortase [Ilumatobacteraceae bacterium]|nr:sortase [Ilumatobacteraceae bacterium]